MAGRNAVRACALASAAWLLLSGCRRDNETAAAGQTDSPGPSAADATSSPSGGSEADASADASAAPPARVGAPVVDIAGLTTLSAPPDAALPRLAAVGWVVPVHEKADSESRRLGTLRAGAIVQATDESADGRGCAKGRWRRILPEGWVCVDNADATADLTTPAVRACDRRPDFGHRLPYMYGVCTRGGPVYARTPTTEHLATHEPTLDRHLEKWRADDESGASYGLDVWLRYTDAKPPTALEALEQKRTDDDIPWFLRDGAVAPNVSTLIKEKDAVKIDQVDRRQGRAFTHSFLYEGRRYNVTPDLTVIPADRFRPIRGSSFHGVQIGRDVDFPFALVRRTGARKWQWQASGKKMVDAGELEWRSAVQLTGKQRFYKQILHYETKDGFWVDDRHAGRIDPAKKWPKWAKNGEKWLDISLTKQVLVAYEGMTGVFATLVSSGEAGLDDPESTTATERGIFRIHTKWATVTMDSEAVGEEFELRDVPYVQYFKDGYALHGAYWHDRFGRPKSHGCVNLAPEDARRIFFWTDPQLPPGWHSVAKSLTGTVVFVHP